MPVERMGPFHPVPFPHSLILSKGVVSYFVRVCITGKSGQQRRSLYGSRNRRPLLGILGAIELLYEFERESCTWPILSLKEPTGLSWTTGQRTPVSRAGYSSYCPIACPKGIKRGVPNERMLMRGTARGLPFS
jgi:hypothetical protein